MRKFPWSALINKWSVEKNRWLRNSGAPLLYPPDESTTACWSGLILVSVKVHESKIYGNDAPSYVNPENLAPRNAQGFGFRINSDSPFLVNMLGSNFRPLPISGSRFLWIFQSSSFGHIQFHSSVLWQQSQEDSFSWISNFRGNKSCPSFIQVDG